MLFKTQTLAATKLEKNIRISGTSISYVFESFEMFNTHCITRELV